MAWRRTIGLYVVLIAAAGTSTLAYAAGGFATPVQFSALPPGAPLNPRPSELPRAPTVELKADMGGTGGVGDAEDADPYGGGYGAGGNVYLPQQPGQGFPLPHVRPIRPPDLRPPPVFRQQMQISPPATGGLRVQIAFAAVG